MFYDLESYYIVQVISARVRNSWIRHANLMELAYMQRLYVTDATLPGGSF